MLKLVMDWLELKRKMEGTTDAKVHAVMEAVDSNKDGKLDFEEFLSLAVSTVCSRTLTSYLFLLFAKSFNNSLVVSAMIGAKRITTLRTTLRKSGAKRTSLTLRVKRVMTAKGKVSQNQIGISCVDCI